MASASSPNNPIPPGQRPLLQRLQAFTPKLGFMTLYMSMAAFNFGYDQGNFSGLQAMTHFQKRFGSFNPDTGEYYLPSHVQSLMTSLPYLGKLMGCWACGLITERIGRKKTMLIIISLSYVSSALMISATTAAQFTTGRVIAFLMTGFTVGVVPVYLAECAPPELRGLMGSQLQFQITFSIMIASFVNLAASSVDAPYQWQITLAVTFLMPTFLAATWYWIDESPRWLVSRGEFEKAVDILTHFRKKHVTRESIEAEVAEITSLGNQGKGNWAEAFSLSNKKRTAIACFVMLGQQITGQVFGSQYGVFFYKSQGIHDPFLMQSISTVTGLVCLFITSTIILDGLGRRFVLLTGGVLQAVFLLCLGGVGSIQNLSESLKSLMVAFLILDGASYNISWAPLSYLTVGEISNSRVREKTAMLAISVSIITAFVVSFTLPYLMNPDYANLGPKVGFIYGGCATIMVTVAYFVVPELKGRTLEEVDELFYSGISMRKFKHAKLEARRTSIVKRDEEQME